MSGVPGTARSPLGDHDPGTPLETIGRLPQRPTACDPGSIVRRSQTMDRPATAGAAASSDAAAHWADQLAGWKISEDILAKAPESPWGFPVGVFKAAARLQEPDSASRAAALEALSSGGSVLDVGCGGGAAALALAPPARALIGVDSSAELLACFAADASAARVAHREVCGSWPDVASSVPMADVVVCHHVVYNIADIVPFLAAIDRHAVRRVVLELTARHPLSATAPLWRHFWNIGRPEGPSADDLLAVLASLGIHPEVIRKNREGHRDRTDSARLAMVRRQLCLPESREPEVAAALAELSADPVEIVTAWWDPT
jgi:SAM-dependent methyltransferase